jgi:Tol biopolymer transport system component
MLPVVVATAFARASLDSAGAEANRPSLLPAISADGRFIAFESEADNLVGGDQNRTADIFLRDTCATATPNSTVRISSAIDGGDANGPSAHAAISADGRFVAFDSLASNLVANDFNQRADVFLRDTCLGAPKGCQPLTEKISSPSATEDADGASHHPSVSANGRLVAFVSAATNLTSGEPNPAEGVFLRDTCRGAEGDCQPVTSVISAVSEGILPAIFHSEPSLSEDGRYVVFVSEFGLASNKRVKIPAARHPFRRRAGVPLQHRDCLNESGGGRRGGWRQLSAPRDRRRPIRCLFLEGDKPCTWRRLEGRSRACLFARYLPAFLGSVRSFDPNRIGRDAKSRP